MTSLKTTSPDSLAPSSPFSNHSNLSTSSVSQTDSPQFITQATYKKPTTKHVTQLTTSSAEGIAVANQCTPERLAHLLLITGPLAIRHITSNLAKQIQGFDKLSLSKQRRLIMSCLNQGYEEESIIFEKIGWGQWRAKKVAQDDFIKERNAIRIANAKVKDSDHGSSNSAAANARRESITKNKYELDQHSKLLNRKSKKDLRDTSMDNEYAIASDDEDEDEEDDDDALSSSSDFSDGEDGGVFKMDDEDQIPPLKLNGRLVSPPMSIPSRRSSHSRGIQKPKFAKTHRSNSQTPTSPELLSYTKKDLKNRTRRNSSIRSTLSTENAMEESETDEEDWQGIGAHKLRTETETMDIDPKYAPGILLKDEQDAAFALVNLRSV
ncbi:CYFA0S14e00122g1_1 [Cyberlindnera fabianii]|uniref:CYFA0S14e00122g1_1 n=1 Tax=Cyberlindnera fabianii TaxID=36022 RepID=A0A061BB30_CYBFA|nr:CYFA0S14e00122g1_1 [Cyberlindnera fabianii]